MARSPLAEKAVDVLILRGGAAETAASPVQPSRSSRCGQSVGTSDKVGALAPHDVRPQAVDQRGGAGKLRGGGSVRTQHQRGEGVKRRVAAHACNRDIAEAVVGEAGTNVSLPPLHTKVSVALAVRRLAVYRLPSGVRASAKRRVISLPGGTPPVQPDNTGHILAEIQNRRRAVRRMQQRNRGAALEHAHRLALAGEPAPGHGRSDLLQGQPAAVQLAQRCGRCAHRGRTRLAVLPKVPLPARIGGNRDAVALSMQVRESSAKMAVCLPYTCRVPFR